MYFMKYLFLFNLQWSIILINCLKQINELDHKNQYFEIHKNNNTNSRIQISSSSSSSSSSSLSLSTTLKNNPFLMSFLNKTYDHSSLIENDELLEQYKLNNLNKQNKWLIQINQTNLIHLTNYTYDYAKDIFIIKLIIIFLYTVIVFIGLAGNLLVLWVVLHVKTLQTITNIFIVNLAISDILMSLVATPFTPISLYMSNWTLPETVCKLLPITMGVSVYVSTLTSMAIALDRFFVIVHPFIPRMKIWLCLLIIITVWIIAILISMPLAVYQQKHEDPINKISACRENWPKESSREVFTIVSFILQFIVPCSIISICYFRISLILEMRLKTPIGCGKKTHTKEEREIRRKRKTNTMLIAMVIIFVICWIPLNILWIVMDINSNEKSITNIQNSKYFTLLFFICHLLAMSSAVYNPFLYAWMNENFRKEFYHILPCILLKPKKSLGFNQIQIYGPEFTTNQLNDNFNLSNLIKNSQTNNNNNNNKQKNNNINNGHDNNDHDNTNNDNSNNDDNINEQQQQQQHKYSVHINEQNSSKDEI